MSIDEFNKTPFRANMKMIYQNREYEIVDVRVEKNKDGLHEIIETYRRVER